jgi:hypothetical protein
MTRILGPLLAMAILAVAAGAAPAPGSAQAVPREGGGVTQGFSFPAPTRHGVLAEPVSLSDYESKTVVLAFFFRARTRG